MHQTAFLSRFRPWLTLCRTHRTVRYAALAICAGALLLGGTLISRSFTAQAPVAIARSLPPSALSRDDQLLYGALFKAQEQGDFDWADALTARITNQLLFGHALAERYLSPHYRAEPEELTVWLANYADHPQAARIRQLAARKGADRDRLAALAPTRNSPLKGSGYVEHLGRRAMPDGWYRGLSLWKERRYGPALAQFGKVAQRQELSGWQQSAAHYWAYRAANRLGDARTAQEHLRRAAQHRVTFYGQLAARRLGLHTQLSAAAPAVPADIRAREGVQRAIALAHIGRDALAESELRQLYSTLAAEQRPAVLALAGELGLANLQVRLAGMKGLSRDERLYARYPMPPWLTSVQDAVDPALLLAIARQESVFRYQARSGAGAVGMMQMLPSTARHIERTLAAAEITIASADSSLPLSRQLHDPAVNIRLGAEYLGILARQPAIRGDMIRMIAAYNAGPGTVAGWQTAAAKIDDPLLYIESIPYPETRNYVMQVLAHRWVYQTLMGQPAHGLDALLQGQWPRFS